MLPQGPMLNHCQVSQPSSQLAFGALIILKLNSRPGVFWSHQKPLMIYIGKSIIGDAAVRDLFDGDGQEQGTTIVEAVKQ